jgi:FKBP-type peptidyl-prolyl cis-trans isomerase FkpA
MRSNNNRLIILFCVLFAFSCRNSSRFKGYTQTDSGLYYKLNEIGDGKHKPVAGDYLQLTITYKTDKDSVFMDTYSSNDMGMVILPFNQPSFEGSFEEGLNSMNEGDRISFIVDAEKLFNYFFKTQLPSFLKKGSIVKMDVKLNRILNQKEYETQLRAYQQMIQDRDIEEQRKLKVFLDTTVVSYSAINQGMYILPIAQGIGSFPQKGDILKINYTGSFLNGKVFESTYERGQPLEYICGEQGQVIKGLEIAINFMNEGAKTKFIIPSHLAFGENGSSTGIVPPYTTVVYEIELLNLTSKIIN